MSCRHCPDLEEREQAAPYVELESLGFVSLRMRVVAAEIQIDCLGNCMPKAGLPCCAMQW